MVTVALIATGNDFVGGFHWKQMLNTASIRQLQEIDNDSVFSARIGNGCLRSNGPGLSQ
jgi:hypothetical protein